MENFVSEFDLKKGFSFIHILSSMLDLFVVHQKKTRLKKNKSPTKLLSPVGCPYEYIYVLRFISLASGLCQNASVEGESVSVIIIRLMHLL